MDQKHIRNFCIIAHIDHGKSTLADRLLELTATVEKRKMQDQMLDTMSIERERGITIKMQPVRMEWVHEGADYLLNLIDTPGHVDFGYEVSRSLAAVEGAILLVDATKGVQAQTLANLEQAIALGLTIVPAVNKIDLPHARVEETREEIAKLLGISAGDILSISGKTGAGVPELLARVVKEVPPPNGNPQAPLKALIFDSAYDSYKGVVANVRIVDGAVKAHEVARFMMAGSSSEIIEVGIFKPALVTGTILNTGEIGYLATGLKEINKVRVGDTVTLEQNQAAQALAGYKEPLRVVFASFFPQSADGFDVLRDALGKLKLNDASFYFEPEQSEALGRGFRCGFLGVLHMDILRERLLREYEIVPLITAPSVSYLITQRGGGEYMIYSPGQIKDPGDVLSIAEPYARVEILTNALYLGQVMKLLDESRGVSKETLYLTAEKVLLRYEVPLAEVVVDFYDRLKSATSGYASLSYEMTGYVKNDLVKMDILIAGDLVEPFAQIVPRFQAERRGRALTEKLKEIVPRQMFAVSVQAAIGGKIIAREDIPAMRKDVTGYLYGGDYSRKKKLLEKQKKGKQRMKASGKVNIPPETYFKMLQR
ncbi:elongation factor 4 [Candidatus Azambacteria bacterium RBG_16_47_10]|uniref:Elongation factor 4 n=1 Tax=Candidatus Azambacteria bacterium RBG_16_47_10 TaxID=1797292 RepID=A0A1F5AYM8_9BACT|nr:MAG: elongation factor 4 [Candidatus Azambacteria bacterium RBG_16_47_10]